MRIKTLILGCLISLTFSPVGFGDDAGHSSALAAAGGRFVFGQTHTSGYQYLLDTQTGRLWVLMPDKDGKQAFEPVTFKGLDGKRALFPQHPDEDMRRSGPILRDLEKSVEKPPSPGKPAPKETKPEK